MKFYLGLHQVSDAEKINLPVFISVSRLIKRKRKVNHKDWIMDSGGFTMIGKYGKYTISEKEYIGCIERHEPKIAFCQDWMCEPSILNKTRLTIKEHQIKTLDSYLSLSKKNERIHPVLQGWEATDYVNHLKMYKREGVEIEQLFGVGTVCSRNGSSKTIEGILSAIKDCEPKIKLHGFGIKSTTLHYVKNLLESSDSMAWSARGRRMKLCHPSCDVKSCSNCLEFALLWRKRMLFDLKK